MTYLKVCVVPLDAMRVLLNTTSPRPNTWYTKYTSGSVAFSPIRISPPVCSNTHGYIQVISIFLDYCFTYNL